MEDWLKEILFGEDESMPPEPRVEEGFLVQRLLSEDIAPLVYFLLKKRGLSHLLSANTMKTLEDFFLLNLGRNFRLCVDVANLLQGFNERGVPHVILKGLALCLFYYPHMGTRRMTDVDILVRKDDLILADSVLASRGYRSIDSTLKEASVLPKGYLASLEYHALDERPIIHLHWDVINTSVPFPSRVSYPLEDLWQRGQTVFIENVETRIPSPEHLVLHLTEHGLKVNHSFDRLILVYDLFVILRQKNIDWMTIRELASSSGLAPFLYFGLAHLKRWRRDLVSPEIEHLFKPRSLSPLQRLYLGLINRDIRVRGLSYLLYLSLFLGPGEKIKFVYRTLLPPLEIGRQRIRSDSSTAGRIYWFRMKEICRMLKLIVRALLIRVDGQASGDRRRFLPD